MRRGAVRPLGAVVTLVALILALLPASAALAGTVTITSVRAVAPGWSSVLEVAAASPDGIERISVAIRTRGAAEPYTTATDFELVGGTAADGVWRTKSPVRLALGLLTLDARAWDETGASVTRESRLDNAAPTRFEFSVSPTDVGPDHGPVTYTGRLLYTGPDGLDHPVPGRQVVIKNGDDQLGVVATDADGRFVGSSLAHRTGDVYAWVQGGWDYKGGYSERIPIKVANTTTRVTASLTPVPKAIGDAGVLSGKLERRTSTGSYVPLARQRIRVFNLPANETTFVRTELDGTYRLDVRAPEAPYWSVSFDPDGQSFIPSTATYRFPDGEFLKHRTTIQGVNAAPEPVAAGAGVTLSGTITRQSAGGTKPLKDAWVAAQFSADGKTWRNASNYATADANGAFKVTAKATQAGYWRAVYDGDPYNLPSVSGGDHVAIKYRTRFSAFNASPEPVRKGGTITVAGTLQRDMGAGWKAGGAGAAINIYFRPAGSSTWTLLTVVKTGTGGTFRKGFTASKDGTWLATYKGSTAYFGSSAPGDHVDVR